MRTAGNGKRASGQGSWQRDPTGRHQWRFRNAGGEWADVVADAGVLSSDPFRTNTAVSDSPLHSSPSSSAKGKLKKPVWRRWWAIMIYALIAVGAIGSLLEDGSEETPSGESSSQPKEVTESSSGPSTSPEAVPPTQTSDLHAEEPRIADTNGLTSTDVPAVTTEPGVVLLDIAVSDWTEQRPAGDRAEVWVRGAGSWYPDLTFGSDRRSTAPFPIGQPNDFFVYPDGRDGAEIQVTFVMTEEMISGAARSVTHVEIYDAQVVVWGEAIPGHEQVFSRPESVGARGNPVPAGEAARVGDWEVTVLSVVPDAGQVVLAENSFNDPPAEGRRFFMVELAATYRGESSESVLWGLSMSAVGESLVAYGGFEDSCGVIPDDIESSAEVFPGGTVTGNVCWQVGDADADSLVLIVDEALSFDSDRVFMALPPPGA